MKVDNRKITFEMLGRDYLDKVVLFLAFTVGILGSLIIKYLNVSFLLPALFSAAIIIAYAIWTFKSESIRLEPEQIGDNAYYLGFVLTLCSLAYTLYEISGHSMESDFIAGVISGFGVALSSTIVGVATRVFMQQFRLDLTAKDNEARLAINKAMQDFRGELTDSIRGMKNFGTELRQSLDEHHEASAKIHEERLNKSMEDVLSGFKIAMNTIVEQGKKANSIMEKNSEETITSTTSSMVEVLKSIEKSVELTGRAVSSATENIGKTVTLRLKENSDALEEHSKLTQQTNKQLKSSISRFNVSIKTIMERLETEISTTTLATETVSESLSKSVLSMEDAIKSVDSDMRSISKKITIHSNEMQTLKRQLTLEESQGANALAQSLETVEKHIINLNSLIDSQSMKINIFIENLSEKTIQLQKNIDKSSIKFNFLNNSERENSFSLYPANVTKK
ncbi:hypothetical protein ELY33_00945 [Vreelandella andesensis]|uniref:MotA/TolQ/ExbB proton channel domain-containing protein n=1 Tax=Vreelandella andesensis TaxID=447567 RepID=A0A433KYQ2_9GAMM|nr:hypothetical protein [Halomonas andesensis]RUR34777.1 hypothetical protein ELY33_00945 [Halomonas andesensis]